MKAEIDSGDDSDVVIASDDDFVPRAVSSDEDEVFKPKNIPKRGSKTQLSTKLKVPTTEEDEMEIDGNSSKAPKRKLEIESFSEQNSDDEPVVKESLPKQKPNRNVLLTVRVKMSIFLYLLESRLRNLPLRPKHLQRKKQRLKRPHHNHQFKSCLILTMKV